MKTEIEKKSIEITIDYENISDVSKVFDMIFSEIAGKRKLGTLYGKRQIGSSTYNYRIRSSADYEYREEMINGNWCQIFKSKMNTK